MAAPSPQMPPRAPYDADGGADFGYPLTAALAYLLVLGYVMRTLFVSIRLPSVVGIILVGFILSLFFQGQIQQARPTLQTLSFFLVLLSAGFGISPKDLRWPLLLLAWGPVLCEIAGITLAAHVMLDFSVIQSIVLGIVSAPLGDGIVIPKMAEMGAVFPSSPLPRIIFVWASLESVLVLPLFGIIEGLAGAAGNERQTVSIGLLGAAAFIQLALTIVVGVVLGLALAWFLPRRTDLIILGRQVFNGSTVEAYLFILGFSLFAFSLGDQNLDGSCFVPSGLTAGCLFNPELCTIVTAMAFAASVDEELLGGVQTALAGTWVFGQILLFAMLGSRASA